MVNRRGQTKIQFAAFMDLIIRFEARLRHFFTIVVRLSWRWLLAKTPRRRDLAIFMITTNDKNDGTNYFALCAYAHGVTSQSSHY